MNFRTVRKLDGEAAFDSVPVLRNFGHSEPSEWPPAASMNHFPRDKLGVFDLFLTSVHSLVGDDLEAVSKLDSILPERDDTPGGDEPGKVAM